MSLKALQWAFEQEAITPTQKLVLIAFANFAGESGKTYPSLSTVKNLCCLQKEETVSSAIGDLLINGMLEHTGLKTGKTGRTIVYQLPLQACQIPPVTGHSAKPNPPCNGALEAPNPPPIPRLAGLPKGIRTLTGEGGVEPQDAPTPKIPNAKFQKPAILDCASESKRIGMPSAEGEAFWHYYESNGWLVGKNKMRCWKSAMQNWKRHWSGSNTANRPVSQTEKRIGSFIFTKDKPPTKEQCGDNLEMYLSDWNRWVASR